MTGTYDFKIGSDDFYRESLKLDGRVSRYSALRTIRITHSKEHSIGNMPEEVSSQATLEDALGALHDHGKFKHYTNDIESGRLDGNMVLSVPHILYEFVDKVKSGDDVEGLSPQIIGVLKKLNVMKLAKDNDGNHLPMEDYFRFIRRIFRNNRLLMDVSDTAEREDIRRFLRDGDLSQVSVTESKVSDSLNPNYKIVMYMATSPLRNHRGKKSHEVLKLFTKYYTNSEECLTDVAFNNFFTQVVGVPGVGEARAVKLKQHVRGEDPSTDAILSLSAAQINDRAGDRCPHALVAPYADFMPLSEYMETFAQSREDVMGILRLVNDTYVRMHKKAFENCNNLGRLPAKQRRILQERLMMVNYNGLIENEISSAGTDLNNQLRKMCVGDWMNEFLEKYPAVIHGDAHHGNVGVVTVPKDGYLREIGLVDFQWARFGLGMEDVVRYVGRSELGLGGGDETELVDDYAEKAGIPWGVADKMWHLAGIFQELKTCRIYALKLAHEFNEEGLEGYEHHLDKAKFHAVNIYIPPVVSDLILAADKEYKAIMNKENQNAEVRSSVKFHPITLSAYAYQMRENTK